MPPRDADARRARSPPLPYPALQEGPSALVRQSSPENPKGFSAVPPSNRTSAGMSQLDQTSSTPAFLQAHPFCHPAKFPEILAAYRHRTKSAQGVQQPPLQTEAWLRRHTPRSGGQGACTPLPRGGRVRNQGRPHLGRARMRCRVNSSRFSSLAPQPRRFHASRVPTLHLPTLHHAMLSDPCCRRDSGHDVRSTVEATTDNGPKIAGSGFTGRTSALIRSSRAKENTLRWEMLTQR